MNEIDLKALQFALFLKLKEMVDEGNPLVYALSKVYSAKQIVDNTINAINN